MEKSVCKKQTVTSHQPSLNHLMQDEMIQKKVSQAFQNGSDYDDSVITVSGYPFTHTHIKNFLTDGQSKGVKSTDVFAHALQTELLNLDFNEKSNDLYKFAQSNELMIETTADDREKAAFRSRKNLDLMCSLMRNTVLPWIRTITGVQISDTIDMFCAQYRYTDVLLCHDDELEDRRIAYIYYLTDDWLERDGGALDLFSVNERGYPDTIVKSIVPSFNSFVFFEVSPISYHQVSEVLAKHKTRLSLSGWFHGKPLPRPQRPLSPLGPSMTFLPAQQDTDLLAQWINPGYLNIATQGTIQEQFEGSSEIQLPGFLLPEKHKELGKALLHLSNFEEFWTLRGPSNKRKYLSMKFNHDFGIVDPSFSDSSERLSKSDTKSTETAALSSVTDSGACGGASSQSKKLPLFSLKTKEAYNLVNDLIRLFCSEEMFLYFSNTTGLSFHPMAANVEDPDEDVADESTPAKRQRIDARKLEEDAAGLNSKCRYEIRCWSHGFYTLLRDTDAEHGEYALDVNLHCCAEGWQQEFGGHTTYIAQGEDAELLTVLPSSNCLSLAYRDSEALRFVKHVNHRVTKPYFDISFVYCE